MLVTLIAVLIIAGIVGWLVNVLPVVYWIKQIIWGLIALFVVLYLLAAFGVHVPILDKLLH